MASNMETRVKQLEDGLAEALKRIEALEKAAAEKSKAAGA